MSSNVEKMLEKMQAENEKEIKQKKMKIVMMVLSLVLLIISGVLAWYWYDAKLLIILFLLNWSYGLSFK